MKITTLFLVALASLAIATPALAKQSRKKGKDPKLAPTASCEKTGASTKRCAIMGNSAELRLKISRAHPLILTLAEKPTFAIKDPYIGHQITEEFILFKLKKDKLPKGHSILVRTESMTLTIFFDVVPTGGDSQVEVVRADQAELDLEVEARVAEEAEQNEADYRQKLTDLDGRVKEEARAQLLTSVHSHGIKSQSPGGEVQSRHDFLVLRAKRSHRVGQERLIEISIEERKGNLFAISGITAMIKQGTAARKVDGGFRCSTMEVRPGKEVKCTVALGAIDKKLGRASVEIKVTGSGSRWVSIQGLDPR